MKTVQYRIAALLCIAGMVAFDSAACNPAIAAKARNSAASAHDRTESLEGTWRLNPAKSQYSPNPAPVSVLRSYRFTSDSVTVITDEVHPDKTRTQSRYTAKFDGAYYLTSSANPQSPETAAWRRVDDRTFEVKIKIRGALRLTLTKVISPDGKTFTDTAIGDTFDGRPVKNVAVYERQ